MFTSSAPRRRILCLLSLFFCLLTATAQELCDFSRTLRIDYLFAGNNSTQHIAVDALSSLEGWAGRRTHMDSLALQGNGRITMRQADSDRVIYRTGFSSLFQEWLTTEEATRTCRSFENVFLLPMPTVPVEITIELDNTHRRTMATLTHRVDPSDILIRRHTAPATPHRYLHRGGTPEACIDVAIVAEGYTEAEMPEFHAKALETVEAIFAHAPFDTLKGRFNFVAVALPSAESDVSVPRQGLWRNTALGAHFDTFYSERYLTTPHLKTLHNSLAGILYEHIIILANTETYGGGGIYNSYTLTTTGHKDFRPVVVHEFGHSFAGLADEYYYDDMYEPYYHADIEPWEQNISTLHNFSSKWLDMLPAGTPQPTPPNAATPERIGIYEGAGYQSRGVYRGFQDCRMKTNSCRSFCPVCQRAIARLVSFYTE